MKSIQKNLLALTLMTLTFATHARDPRSDFPMYQKYDGKQANDTGCYRDAITAASKKETAGSYIVRVELRYSPSCGTNWARIYYENYIYGL